MDLNSTIKQQIMQAAIAATEGVDPETVEGAVIGTPPRELPEEALKSLINTVKLLREIDSAS